MGPGLTTGAADDDPSGIGTYSQAGAQFGFNLLWLAPLTFPLMAVVQEMCARIGLVTGRGLASNIRLHYSRKVLYACVALLFLANTFNIGADLGAMAQGAQLLAPRMNFTLLIFIFAGVTLGLQIFTTYQRYARDLKWLAFILLSYVASALIVKLPFETILIHTVVPHLSFSKDEVFLVCGILGTTISPYLFFWQTSQEVEDQVLKGNTTLKERQDHATAKTIRGMRVDVWSGMFVSNVVMFFIIAACAATLYAHGIRTIGSAADAALALRPLAGNAAYFLFAVGIIGTGMLAVPVLAGSTSYALSESLGWREGLFHKLKEAYAFYGVIIISMILGIILNFIHIDPIRALIYSAVANGLVAPVVLILIVQMSADKNIMGRRANSRWVSMIGWFVVTLMTVAGIAAIISLFF